MIITDLLVLAALTAFSIGWWLPLWAGRQRLLVASASIALLAGLAGTLDDRWQDALGAATGGLLLLVLLVGRRRNKPASTGLPWASGSAILALVFLSGTLIYLFPIPDLPAPTGQHRVGTQSFALTDSSRPGVFSTGENTPRQLLVRVWYPAKEIKGRQPRPYFTEAEADSTAAGLGQIMGMPFLFKYTKHSMTNSYPDAPLVEATEGLPVLIYSHGYTSFAGQNTTLMEELASHGYVVYSVQHSYDAAPTLLPNGDVLPMDPALVASAGKPPTITNAMKNAYAGSTLADRYQGQIDMQRQYHEQGNRIIVSAPIWLADRLFVLEELQNQRVQEPVKELVAASDFTATGQLGMSFGGSTTGGLCMIDSRCVAGINLDGSDFHVSPLGQNMPVPFMMFYSDFRGMAQWTGSDENSLLRGFNDFSYERPELAGLRDDVYRMVTGNVKHLGISDFTLFTRNPVREVLFGSINALAMIRIQNELVRGFFDTHLLGLDVGFPEKQYGQLADWVQPAKIDDVRNWWLESHPRDSVERVVLETHLGNIEVALYPERAPLAVANFLAYVAAGHFEGASFYRVTDHQSQGIDIVQGGLLAHLIDQPQSILESAIPPLPAIAHETTQSTGIPNERGTLAYARLAPGTAGSEFFFNLGDNTDLNTGENTRNPDGQGYTAFGRVMRGMRVLEQIQAMATGGGSQTGAFQGQILTTPVNINRAYTISSNRE